MKRTALSSFHSICSVCLIKHGFYDSVFALHFFFETTKENELKRIYH